MTLKNMILQDSENPFSFVLLNKSNKIAALIAVLFVFAFFWAVFYYLIDNYGKLQRIPPVTIAAILLTVQFFITLYLIFALYANLKSRLLKVKCTTGDKIEFCLKIMLVLSLAPGFIKILADFFTGANINANLIALLFLVPAWVFLSFMIKKMLHSFYLMSVAAIILLTIIASVLFGAPFLENILPAYGTLSDSLGIFSALFFPALLIDLIFIEFPSLLEKKNSNT